MDIKVKEYVHHTFCYCCNRWSVLSGNVALFHHYLEFLKQSLKHCGRLLHANHDFRWLQSQMLSPYSSNLTA